MRLLRSLMLVLPAMLMARAAFAHTPIEGIGGLLNGVLHPVLVPQHTVALLAAGLLLGRQGVVGMQRGLPTFMVAVGIGLVALWLGSAADATVPLLIAAATTGVLVALAVPLPEILWLAFTLTTGVLVGLDSAPEGMTGNERIAALVGTGIGTTFLMLYVAGLTENLERPWQRVGIRILGSWLVAITIMVLALSLARIGGAPAVQ